MIRLLTFTNLFPNPVQSRHGIFVEHRLRRLLATGRFEAQVIAPVPWCPLPIEKRYPEYRIEGVPAIDNRSGVSVYHPRYWILPGVTSHLHPWIMMQAALPLARRLISEGYDFDVIDAQYVFPDGIAGVLLARRLGKPVTLTARGSDINVAMQEHVPRRWFNWAMRHVSAFIAVSAALKVRMLELGVAPERLEVIRNGVDLDLFAERDRAVMREQMGISGALLLSVGHLVPNKGHHLVIDALRELRNCSLAIIGTGPLAAQLDQQARAAGVSERVRFLPNVGQHELAAYYSAADVTILASEREGMPNVVLESLACGTPVVATNTGGASEILGEQVRIGRLLGVRSATAIADAVTSILKAAPARQLVRDYATRFAWDEPIARQARLFEEVCAQSAIARVA